MKTRNGFVSNSSSTSFVIYSREPVNEDILTTKLSGVPENSPFYPVVRQLFRNLLDSGYTKIDPTKAKKATDYYGKQVYEIGEDWRVSNCDAELIDKGLVYFYHESVQTYGDGGDALGTILCDYLSLDYKSEDLVVQKGTSY